MEHVEVLKYTVTNFSETAADVLSTLTQRWCLSRKLQDREKPFGSAITIQKKPNDHDDANGLYYQ
jgi:hypothetical protein